MYHVSLFEDGRFCSHIGGEVRTLSEAVRQMREVAVGLQAERLQGYEGLKFDRARTPCALIVTDEWGQLIKEVKDGI